MKIANTITVKSRVFKYYCDSCGQLLKTIDEGVLCDFNDVREISNTTISISGDNGFNLIRLICPECKERIKNKIELLLINEHLYDGSDPSNITS